MDLLNSAQSNQLLFLNSDLATETAGGTKFFKLDSPLQARRGNRILCEVAEAQLPVSYYNVRNSNNIFSVTAQKASDSVDRTVTIYIPVGNYNVTELVAELNSLMAAAVSASFPFTSTFSFDAKTMKISLVLSVTGDSVSSASVNSRTTCLKLIGFTGSESAVISTTVTFTGTNVVNLTHTMNIFVRTNLKCDNIDSTGTKSGYIAKIQVTENFGEIVHYHNIESVKVQLANSYIDVLEVHLEDDDGDIIEFNGVPFHMTFAFFYIEERVQKYVKTMHDKMAELDNVHADMDDSD